MATSRDAKIVSYNIITLEDSTILWLDQETQANYQDLIQKVLINLGDDASLLHNGIPGNPCYVVFAFGNFDYALFLDRQCDEDGQIVHLIKREKGFDYSTHWIS